MKEKKKQKLLKAGSEARARAKKEKEREREEREQDDPGGEERPRADERPGLGPDRLLTSRPAARRRGARNRPSQPDEPVRSTCMTMKLTRMFGAFWVRAPSQDRPGLPAPRQMLMLWGMEEGSRVS